MRRMIVAFLVAIFFSIQNISALTLAQVRTEVRRFIKDKADPKIRYSDDILNDYINESQRSVVTDTLCLQKSTAVVLVAGTSYYSLPSDLMLVKLVNFKDQTNRKRDLSETSYKAVRQNNPDYERQTGPPMQYTIRSSTGTSTQLEICFLPVATSASTGTVVIDYFNQATDLASDSTVFLDGDATLVPYHQVIVYQTVGKIKLLEGDATTASLFFQLYSSAITAMNSRLGEYPNLTPGFSAGTAGSSAGPGR